MTPDTIRDFWFAFQREHRCSIDQMLCDPVLRQEFVALGLRDTTCPNERDLLQRLLNLRKRKSLPGAWR